MSKIVIHIPHSKLRLPNKFWKKTVIDKKIIENENTIITDLYVEKLVSNLKNKKIIFKYSRLFCDVERYKNDDVEAMSKLGMGVVYKNTLYYKDFIKYDKKYKNSIVNNYYLKHHNKFNKKVSQTIKKYGKCIILDLHSYSDEIAKVLLNRENCPDICIGVNEENSLSNFSKKYFDKLGYSVKINYPYSGSIISNKHLNNKNVESIMLEINKRVYMNDNNKFEKLKVEIGNYIKEIESKG